MGACRCAIAHRYTTMSAADSRPSQAAPEDRPASPAAPAAGAAASLEWREGWFTFQVADVSDETAAKITKAGAWPAFTAFQRLLWKRQREAAKAGNERREAALKSGRLDGDGIKGLARSIGANPKAICRQLRALEDLGIVRVLRPPVTLARNSLGKLVARPVAKGLVQPVRIRFTAGDPHKRPANRQGYGRPSRKAGGRTRQGYVVPSEGRRAEGTSYPTPISPRNTSPAGGRTDGFGPPAGRTAAEAAAAWHARDPEAERRRREYLEAKERRKAAREAEEATRSEQAAAGPPDPPPAPVDATQAAAGLREAVAALPAASRRKARREAKRLSEADRQADEEAKRLSDLIDKRRAAGQGGPPLPPAAFREKAKQAFRKARRRPPAAAAREPVPA